jgi:predicted O-linked N-acetylglucosamine transferase (SPINDLY family)
MTDSVFLSAIAKITERNFTVLELIGTAEALTAAKRTDLAIQLYRIWISFNADAPLLYVVNFNLAVLLSARGDLGAATEALEAALALKADFFPAHINLGGVFERRGELEKAINQWMNIVNQLPSATSAAIRFKSEALKQIGRVMEQGHQAAAAETMLRRGLDTDPNQPEVAQHVIALRMGQCEWPIVSPWEGVDRKTLMDGIGPLSMLGYSDDPMLQLATATSYCRHFVGYPPINLQADPQTAHRGRQSDRLRIGYVSSDLRQHAVGFLTAELFELHDRKAVEVFAYYCGIPGDDPTKDRIKAAVEHWVDLTGIDDIAAAQRIAADGIDILVDLNGYTKDARLKVFAMRPAPIIVNWLGYPGTMGGPIHHYIIADENIIPPELEIYYSEKVVRLPCYQPSDRKRFIAPSRPTRGEVGLPEDAFVYCCFNGTQKINRFTFERWMAILRQVPNSVLWLLDGAEGVADRLKGIAEQLGVPSGRVIFAEKMANPNHLARYPLADLFLDTAPYGAHTTASDALWLGVPVLTYPGRCMASRVCSSLVRAAGIPELVCNSAEEYLARAVEIGCRREEALRYKERLVQQHNTCTLFDIEGLARNLEGLYRQMWEDYQEGRLPVPDLTNIELYRELGLERDHEGAELVRMSDYIDGYREKIAARHRSWPVPPDGRLWTPEVISQWAGKPQR